MKSHARVFQEQTVVLGDGYEAYARYWPCDNPRGAVLYLHGIQSHSGWYETSARRLAEAGFSVLQVDRRGSGRNLPQRGHARSAQQLVEDVASSREHLLRASGHDACHVVGVSWGGKQAVAAYVEDPRNTRSLSLVTPGLFPKIGVSRGEMAKIGMAMLYEPQQRFDIPLNDPELFTSVPKWQSFFRTDVPTLRQCTASFYLASRRMDRICAKLRETSPIPIHLLLAGDERIVDNGRTSSFIRQLAWPSSVITTYEKARHSLEFEGDPEIYFRDLVAFIARVNDVSPARIDA